MCTHRDIKMYMYMIQGCVVHADASVGQNTEIVLQGGAIKANHTPHGRKR